MEKPELIYGPFPDKKDTAFVRCPGCQETLWINQDQYEGKVSMDCPECDYHETHDVSNG